MNQRAAVKAKVSQNSHQLDILSTSDLVAIWEEKTGKTFSESFGQVAAVVANFAAPMIDVATATKLINEVGLDGKVATKVVNGKTYVIFKGRAGQRSIFSRGHVISLQTQKW